MLNTINNGDRTPVQRHSRQALYFPINHSHTIDSIPSQMCPNKETRYTYRYDKMKDGAVMTNCMYEN